VSVELIAYAMAVYLIAGTVKGVIGFGMPIVSLAMLAAVIGLTESIVLMLVPALVTNIWQGITGGRFVVLVRRLWLLLALACVSIWLSTAILVSVDGGGLTAVLGSLLIVYAAFSLVVRQIPAPGRHEIWLSPLIGVVAGVAIGLTGVFVMPGTVYLQSLRLSKNELVQSLGISFVVTTLALGLSLSGRGALPVDLVMISGAAVVPTMLGMILGKKYRDQLPEDLFRRYFFIALLIVGCWLSLKPLVL
jgi:uncharacterized membrane protein YfcA